MKQGKYSIIYNNDDGSIEEWIYDSDITKNGPIETIITYPKGKKQLTYDEKLELSNKKMPQSQKQYWNPASDRLVSYGRAKQLKLI